jgi:flagellar assembly protein FliH
MISPSDVQQDVNPTVAGRNHHWNSDSVLPLEFKAVDHPLRRKTDWMGNQHEDFDGHDVELRDNLEKLQARFLAQTQQMSNLVLAAERETRLTARAEWASELEERIATERQAIAVASEEFAKDRAKYFASVEAEVVRLALAIATRVLHREAKLDPLLLSAVVRMALEKVEDDSTSVLHVPVADVEAWRTLLSREKQSTVTLIGEEGMQASECVLETTVGRVEMGVVAQLGEIEKGFFDLLQQRPA